MNVSITINGTRRGHFSASSSEMTRLLDALAKWSNAESPAPDGHWEWIRETEQRGFLALVFDPPTHAPPNTRAGR